jgi:hypothetical protein
LVYPNSQVIKFVMQALRPSLEIHDTITLLLYLLAVFWFRLHNCNFNAKAATIHTVIFLKNNNNPPACPVQLPHLTYASQSHMRFM